MSKSKLGSGERWPGPWHAVYFDQVKKVTTRIVLVKEWILDCKPAKIKTIQFKISLLEMANEDEFDELELGDAVREQLLQSNILLVDTFIDWATKWELFLTRAEFQIDDVVINFVIFDHLTRACSMLLSYRFIAEIPVVATAQHAMRLLCKGMFLPGSKPNSEIYDIIDHFFDFDKDNLLMFAFECKMNAQKDLNVRCKPNINSGDMVCSYMHARHMNTLTHAPTCT